MPDQNSLAKIEAGIAAVNAQDVDGLLGLLEPGFQLNVILKPEQLLPPGQISGGQAIGEYLAMIFSAFPDFHLESRSLNGDGDLVHQQVVAHGTHLGLLTLPDGKLLSATRIQVQLPVEIFHSFNVSGGYVASTSYVNLLDVMRQFRR